MTRKKTTKDKPLQSESARRKALKPKTGTATAEDIAGLLAKAPPPTPNGAAAQATRLPRRGILAAEEGVFQFRRCERDPYRSGVHIGELARALLNAGKPFEPLLVFPAGGKYYVMDGHHRLSAYEAADWDKPVPVEVFQGTLEEARFAALKANSWDKLPMKREDKLEAVWRFVREESGHTKQQLTDLGLAANGTIGAMRKKWSEIKATGDTKLLAMSWGQAKQWTVGQEIEQDLEGWRERKIKEWEDRLITAGIAKGLAEQGEFVIEALCRVAPDLPMRAVTMADPDAVLAWTQDFREVDGRAAYHRDPDDPLEHEF